jgi:hypothetical protein
MSQIPLISEVSAASVRFSPSRTWAGTLVTTAERAAHYLHLVAFPCAKCKGPVILGWIGTRADDISNETEIKKVGAVCLACGRCPETLIDPLEVSHFRPVQWEWTIEKKPEAIEPGGDPLPAELSLDADTDQSFTRATLRDVKPFPGPAVR